MLYDRIKLLARSKGLSIYKLEKDLNFSNGSICKWNEYKPNFERLKKVADYLDVPMEELMEETQEV